LANWPLIEEPPPSTRACSYLRAVDSFLGIVVADDLRRDLEIVQ